MTRSCPKVIKVVTLGPPGPIGSRWLTGATAPAAGLGANGDLYLQSNGDIYGPKTVAGWGQVVGQLRIPISTSPAQPLAATATPGATGLPADAGHRHPFPTAQEVGADTSGTAAAAVAGHAAAADPHPQYTTPQEAAAAAPVQSVALSLPTGWSASSSNQGGSVTLSLSLPAGYGLLAASDQAAWNTAAALAGTAVQPAALTTALAGKADLVGGLVPSAQLPSFVDDVLEYANLAAFPATGETGKIYVDRATGKIYRWSGSQYIEISASPGSTDAVPEGATNLYFTAGRASAAAPVQSVAGRTGAVTLAVADVSGAASIGLAAGLALALG